MPWYDFYCDDCENEFELFMPADADHENVECPDCGGQHTERIFKNISFGKRLKNRSSGSCSTGWSGG